MIRSMGVRTIGVAVAVALSTMVLAVPAGARPGRPADHADTQAALDRYQATAGPGAAVYAGNRTSDWQLTKGTAAINANRPIAATDHFRAASQTKSFTSAVVLQLVDEGRVELDAPIERYLPGVVTGNGHDGTKMHVRHILQHTAGIADPAVTDYLSIVKPDGTIALRDLVRIGLSKPSLGEPGAQIEYSNSGYHLASLLIEQVTGVTIAEAVTSRIITPLGLAETTFPNPGDKSLATPYVPGYRGIRFGPLFFWTETTFGIPGVNVDVVSSASGAGAIVSTQKDLVKFFRALSDGRVISPTALAEMRRAIPVGLPGYGYGLGLERQPLSCGGVAWGHPGDMPTGTSSRTVVTDDGRHAMVVTNAFALSSAGLQAAVADSALCGSQ